MEVRCHNLHVRQCQDQFLPSQSINISLIIKTIDAKKGHGWDNISIKMIQICGDPIALPLMFVFETTLKEKKFPDIWKKANVVSVHKKE